MQLFVYICHSSRNFYQIVVCSFVHIFFYPFKLSQITCKINERTNVSWQKGGRNVCVCVCISNHYISFALQNSLSLYSPVSLFPTHLGLQLLTSFKVYLTYPSWRKHRLFVLKVCYLYCYMGQHSHLLIYNYYSH